MSKSVLAIWGVVGRKVWLLSTGRSLDFRLGNGLKYGKEVGLCLRNW